MRNNDFKNLCDRVKYADKNDPIWYAGYLWIDLTEKQIDKVIAICNLCKVCYKKSIGNMLFERNVLETPSGMKLYGEHDKVFSDIKTLIEGCSNYRANEFILDLYNVNFITCGEYRVMCDWIERHTDCNGAIIQDWN